MSNEERGRLLVCAEFHMGDSINVLRPGSLNVQPRDTSTPSLSLLSNVADFRSILYGTVSGAIGAIISIPKPLFTFLSELESSMRRVLPSIGGLSHSEYR